MESPTHASDTCPRESPRDKFFLLTAVVLAAVGIALRFRHLSLQGYWTDEQFTVLQTSSSLGQEGAMGLTEVHTPFFAFVVHAWIHATGSIAPGATRALTALIGSWGVVEAWWGLRRARLGADERAVALVAVGTSGFAITYSQDVRPYALAGSLLLAALLQHKVTWRRVCAALLVSSVPQVSWIAFGSTVPASRGGKVFPAPQPIDLWRLGTTIFAAGRIHMLVGGFLWSAPWLFGGLLILLVVVLGSRRVALGPGKLEQTHSPAGVLGLATAIFVATMYGVSQVVHLWTLRNMIVIAPAAAWALLWAITSYANRQVRAAAAWACRAMMGTSIVPISQELGHKYKTDFISGAQYLVSERLADPEPATHRKFQSRVVDWRIVPSVCCRSSGELPSDSYDPP